ncbi:MAG TPA: phosphate ABC transporter permease PstA [Acidimicrobiales bacterium]
MAPSPFGLARRRLGRGQLLALAGACVAGTVALGATRALGWSLSLVLLFGAYLVVSTTAAWRLEGRRPAVNRLACTLLGAAVVVTLIPLLAVLGYTLAKGGKALDGHFLTHSMRGVGPLEASGGEYHAVIGTLEQVLVASVISIPLGLLTAIFVVEYGRGRMALLVRFFVDVMTGVPSIVAGLFVFAFWVIGLHKGFSGFAAGMALAVLMLPVVARASEEMLRLVPKELRDASYALGIPKWRTITSVVLPAASAGITTGVILAVARVTGETAPLLLTAFGFDSVRTGVFRGPQSALPLYVFSQASSAFDVAVHRAWAGALTLILIVLVLSVVARIVTRRNTLSAM